MTVENDKADEQLQAAEAAVMDKEAPEQGADELLVEGDVLAADQEAPAAEQAAQDASAPEQAADHWRQQAEALAAQLEQARDQTLRAQAELQNVKRRAQLDVEKAHKYALDRFVESLLPVVDSLEKGVESASRAEGSHEAMKEGMDLTLKLFLDTLSRFKVEPINPEGEPFDPNFHQAMSMVPNPQVEANTVLTVFQKGYTLNERVVRPAMVVVSKGS